MAAVAAMTMTMTMMVVVATAMRIKVATAMVGGTDNNQLKAAVEEMVAAGATAMENVMVTAMRRH